MRLKVCRNSRSRSVKPASAAAGRAEITISRSPGISDIVARNTSFSRLRTALRTTALPTFLETDRPNLGVPNSFGKAWTENNLPL